jgi:hypothetical protein
MSAKAVEIVKKEKNNKVFQQKLLHIYYYNLLFNIKDKLLNNIVPSKQDLELKNIVTLLFDKQFKKVKKIMGTKNEEFYRCNPPF